MDLLSQPDEVRYFSINGCNFYTCWLNEKEIAFGSGEIELLITNNMSEQEITNLFAAYIDSRYSDRIEYDFWRKIRTMKQKRKFLICVRNMNTQKFKYGKMENL